MISLQHLTKSMSAINRYKFEPGLGERKLRFRASGKYHALIFMLDVISVVGGRSISDVCHDDLLADL